MKPMLGKRRTSVILAAVFLLVGFVAWDHEDFFPAGGAIRPWTAVYIARKDFARTFHEPTWKLFRFHVKRQGDLYNAYLWTWKMMMGGDATYEIDAHSGKIVRCVFGQ